MNSLLAATRPTVALHRLRPQCLNFKIPLAGASPFATGAIHHYSRQSRKSRARRDQQRGAALERDSESRSGRALLKERKRVRGSDRDQLDDEPSFFWDDIRDTIELPKPEELPFHSRKVLEDPIGVLRDVGEVARLTIKFKVGTPQRGRQHYYKATCTVLRQGKLLWEKVGHGTGSTEARKTAALRALAQLREDGLLPEPIYRPQRVDNEDVQAEKSGIVDVYNYAARYGCFPKIAYSTVGRYTNVTIDMPELNIHTKFSVHGGYERVETAVVKAFKEAAERYKSESKHDGPAEETVSLSTVNARDFLDFCKSTCRETLWLGTSLTHVRNSHTVGRPSLNDVPLEPGTEVNALRKADAEKITQLLGALTIAKHKPELLEKFQKILRENKGQYLAPARPRDLLISEDSLHRMQQLARHTQNSYLRTQGPTLSDDNPDRRPRPRPVLTEEELAQRSAYLQAKLKEYQERPDLAPLRKARSDLPMSQYTSQVRQIVQNNIYSVIIGATGSGKTTQVPQILLEEAIESGTGASCNIICTNPRRIAATSVASRVANERAEALQDTVGYHVRFDAKLPKPHGSILYCTTGILLAQLQNAPDEVYDHVSHLVIDEVHERDMVIDFLLITLKKSMAARAAQGKRLPRVVLMSATIDAQLFTTYFKDSLYPGKSTDCPTLSVPGRTFPVKQWYLDDILRDMNEAHGEARVKKLLLEHKDTMEYLAAEKSDSSDRRFDAETSQDLPVIDWKKTAVTADVNDALGDGKDDALVPLSLASTTIAHIAKTTEHGAILVFLPGLDEIVKLDRMLAEVKPLGVDFQDPERFRIFKLHSSIPDSQKTVFEPVPDGCRKIILSTNIAETSVTIPDVQYVVDTGKLREKRYDQERRITQLRCTWVSKSNAKQRAGRAGRVQNGNYYALYTRSRHDSLSAIGLPELLRSDLQETCLDVKVQAFKMPVRDFLAEAIEPPSSDAVVKAMDNLVALGALNRDEELTPLGRLLAKLPVHPTLGKMIVLGIVFRCLDPMIMLGASVEARSLFLNPLEKRREVDAVRKQFARHSQSDHIAALNAYRMTRRVSTQAGQRDAFDYYHDNFIHFGAFSTIRSTAREIEEILYTAGLIQERSLPGGELGGPMLNQNSGSDAVIKALLLAGLYPNLALHLKGDIFRTASEKATFVHPSSINSRARTSDYLLTFTSLALSSDGNRLTMRDTTFVSPLVAVLFGGQVTGRQKIIELDDWLPLYVNKRPGQLGLHDLNTHGFRSSARVPPSHTIVNFRRALDDMLAVAFNDLAKNKPLADEPTRERMSEGLADILAWEEDAEAEDGAQFSGSRARDQALPNSRASWSSQTSPWAGHDRQRYSLEPRQGMQGPPRGSRSSQASALAGRSRQRYSLEPRQGTQGPPPGSSVRRLDLGRGLNTLEDDSQRRQRPLPLSPAELRERYLQAQAST